MVLEGLELDVSGALDVGCAILVGGADVEQNEGLGVEGFFDEVLGLGDVEVGFDLHLLWGWFRDGG